MLVERKRLQEEERRRREEWRRGRRRERRIEEVQAKDCWVAERRRL